MPEDHTGTAPILRIDPLEPGHENQAQSAGAIQIRHFSFSIDHGRNLVLEDISLNIPENTVTTFIGANQSGKSILLRCLNRLNDSLPGARITSGSINIFGKDIHSPEVSPEELRRDVGMVLQDARPLPFSIRENITFAIRSAPWQSKINKDELVEQSLLDTGLWESVRDSLRKPALGLSRSDQQLLCIARALALKPKVLILEEPSAPLSSGESAKIESTIAALSEDCTVIIATHNIQQATRLSDNTAFFHLGQLIEFDLTSKVFTNPAVKKTEEFISGKFG